VRKLYFKGDVLRGVVIGGKSLANAGEVYRVPSLVHYITVVAAQAGGSELDLRLETVDVMVVTILKCNLPEVPL